MEAGLLNAEATTLPLGPHHCLRVGLAWANEAILQEPDDAIALTSRDVERVNLMTAKHADRQLFMTLGSPWPEALGLRCS
jgi:hypothetical protein